jgi:translation initiation factor IF-3
MGGFRICRGPLSFLYGHGESYIARSPMQTPPSKDGPRVNDMITAQMIRLIDQDGEQVGVVHIREAQEMADEAGLDLVEISPSAEPPVCKILDYGKFKYENQKRKAEQRKKAKVIEVKEIKMRPNIDDNDYNVKMRSLKRFIEEGDKVKVTLRFRGRELAHQSIGMDVLNRVREETVEFVKVEQFPKMEGRQMTMLLAPR